MRGSRKNRLRVPRETCVGVDVGSAVGRRGGREICEFFFLLLSARELADLARQFAKTEEANKRKTQHCPTRKRQRRPRQRQWQRLRQRQRQKQWSSRTKLPKTLIPIATHTHTRAHRANLQRRAPFLSRDFFTLSYESEQHKKRKMFAKSLLKKVNIR